MIIIGKGDAIPLSPGQIKGNVFVIVAGDDSLDDVFFSVIFTVPVDVVKDYVAVMIPSPRLY